MKSQKKHHIVKKKALAEGGMGPPANFEGLGAFLKVHFPLLYLSPPLLPRFQTASVTENGVKKIITRGVATLGSSRHVPTHNFHKILRKICI